MKRGMRVLGQVAFLPLLAGCWEIGPILGPDIFGTSGACYFCATFDLMIERGTATILKGDTIHVRIWSSMGHDRGTFSVNGSALRLVNGTSLATAVTTPAPEAVVVAVAVGRDTVKSEAADTAASARLGIRVVDSASVTAIQTGLEPNPKLRVGEVRQLDVFLLVGQEMVYGGPTSMTVGNPAVLFAEPAQVNPKAIFLRAKAVGITSFTIRFLDRTATYQVEVIP